MVTLPDVTVMVPLHRSALFRDIVDANLTRLSPHALFVISDATGEDDTLTWLRQRHLDKSHITWLGPRDIAPGWVAHCNDIVRYCSTAFVMWLPHDDEIDAEYLERCRSTISADAQLGAVVGQVLSLAQSGHHHQTQPAFPSDERVRAFVLPANAYLAEWNLGILFRALVRRSAWRPLPHTVFDDEWSDMVWAYGLALEWAVCEVHDISYRKRFYDGSTSTTWASEFYPRALPFLIRELEQRITVDLFRAAAIELVDIVTARTADVVDERSRRARMLQTRLDGMTSSLPFRLSAPLRHFWRALRPDS